MQITAEQLWSKVGRQTVEIELLQEQAASLQQQLALAQQRVGELEAERPSDSHPRDVFE